MNATVSISSSYFDDSDNSVSGISGSVIIRNSPRVPFRRPLARSTPISKATTTSSSAAVICKSSTPVFTPLTSKNRFNYQVLRRKLFHVSSSSRPRSAASSSSGIGTSTSDSPMNFELRQDADGCEEGNICLQRSGVNNATYTVLPVNYKSTIPLLDRVHTLKLELPRSRMSKSRKMMIRNRFKNINNKQFQSLGVV